jgi:uncharacterized protein YjiK
VDPVTWGQYGLAGLVAMTLGAIIGYVFKLLIQSSSAALKDCQDERNQLRIEASAVRDRMEDRQKQSLLVLADVSRVMAEVQNLLREREIERKIENRHAR